MATGDTILFTEYETVKTAVETAITTTEATFEWATPA